MTRWLRTGALIVGFALPSSAAALDCDGTTIDIIECAQATLAQADADLNEVYKTVMAQAKSAGFDTELRAAQRLWIPYRDAACEAAAARYRGGSIEPVVRLGCLVDLTEKRTQELRLLTSN